MRQGGRRGGYLLARYGRSQPLAIGIASPTSAADPWNCGRRWRQLRTALRVMGLSRSTGEILLDSRRLVASRLIGCVRHSDAGKTGFDRHSNIAKIRDWHTNAAKTAVIRRMSGDDERPAGLAFGEVL
jgi:hypothetical protein